MPDFMPSAITYSNLAMFFDGHIIANNKGIWKAAGHFS